jgi:dienelactone hydrolase
VRRPPPVRALLSGALVVAMLGGCTATAPDDEPQSGPTATATAGPTPSSAPLYAFEVATRDLALRDGNRTTDPTPGSAGDDASDGRDLPTTLWYPTTGNGPFPVVVFSHGLSSEPWAYRDLLAGWASSGLVVAAPAFPLTRRGSGEVTDDIVNQPADVSFVLDQVLALNTGADDELAGRIDPSRIAVAGHSAGAITTLGLLNGCCTDARVTAAVVLAGTTQGFGSDPAEPGVPTLFVHGTADEVLDLAQGRAAFEAATGPKAFLELVAGSHSTPYDLRTDVLWPTMLAATTDFLRWSLTGDPAALEALRTDADQPGFAALTDDRLGG